MAFVPVAGTPCNYGVVLDINIFRFSGYFQRKKMTVDEDFMESLMIAQPARISQMASLYMRCCFEHKDPFNIFFSDDEYVMDLTYLMSLAQVPVAVLRLRNLMAKQSEETFREMESQIVLDSHILQLYGCIRNPVIENLKHVSKYSRLENMSNSWDTTFLAGFQESIESMTTGILLHFSAAAASIIDLKAQGNRYGQDYVTEIQRLRKESRFFDYSNPRSLAHAGNKVAVYSENLRGLLRLGISWSNHHLMDAMLLSAVGFFMKQPKQWGSTIWISDMAQTTRVLLEEDYRKNITRSSCYYNAKAPGMGIDSINDLYGVMQNAYGTYLTDNARLLAYYSTPESRDVTMHWASSLSLATLCGAGVKRTAMGSLDLESRLFTREAGVNVSFPEMQKTNTGSVKSDNIAQEIEPNLPDSGKGDGTKKVPWQSTENQKATVYEQLFQGIPLLIMCSNKNNTRQPRSMKMGGRVQYFHSSVMDNENGVIYANSKSPSNSPVQTPHISNEELEAVKDDSDSKNKKRVSRVNRSPNTSRRKARKVSDKDMRFMDNFSVDARAPLGSIDYEKANQHRLYFLVRHLIRKAFPFVHRVMTAHSTRNQFSFRLNWKEMYGNVMRLTKDVRRSWIDNDDTAFRTFHGPYVTSIAIPVWVESSVWRCVVASVDRASHSSMEVNLQQGMQDSIKAVMDMPISAHTQIDALYKWFTTSLLDGNVMALSCYALFTMGFKDFCSLETIAKVCCQLDLTKSEEDQYEKLCEFLVPIVSYDSRTEYKKALLDPRYTRTIPHKQLVMPSMDMLRAWFRKNKKRKDEGRNHGDSDDDDAPEITHEDLKSDIESRMNAMPSTYLRPSVNFVETEAKWVHNDVRYSDVKFKNKGPARHADSFVTDDILCAVSQAFACQQTEEAHKTRMMSENLPQHQHVHAYWMASNAGIRLPMPHKTLKKSDESSNQNFDPVWQTGTWYNDVIEQLNGATGPIRQFLVMCQFPSDVSRCDFFSKLLQPYFDKQGITTRKIIRSPLWKTPIMKSSIDGEFACDRAAFAFACLQNDGKWRSGYSGGKGMQVMLGMDVMWMLVAQGLYCREWSSSSLESKAVIHLRGLASAAKSLLGMFLHTMVEKSAVPVAPIFLTSPSPEILDKGVAASVDFFPRLHVDSFTFDHTNDETSFLCSSVRQCHHFKRLRDTDDQFTYYYNCIDDCDEFTPIPWPPESFSHMQPYLPLILRARDRFQSQYGSTSFDIPTIMRIYGQSVEVNHVTYLSSTLTTVLLREGIELPCLTFYGGFVYTLRVCGGRFEVVPVECDYNYLPLSDLETISSDIAMWRPLPVCQKTTFPLDEIDNFMCHGLTYQPAISSNSGNVYTGHVTLVRPGQTHSTDTLPLCSFFFPIVEWEVLCVFCKTHAVALLDNAIEVRVVDVENATRSEEHLFLSGDKFETWCSYNSILWKDIQSLSGFIALHIVDQMGQFDCDGYDAAVADHLRFWIEVESSVPSDSKSRDVFHFNSTKHLRVVVNGACNRSPSVIDIASHFNDPEHGFEYNHVHTHLLVAALRKEDATHSHDTIFYPILIDDRGREFISWDDFVVRDETIVYFPRTGMTIMTLPTPVINANDPVGFGLIRRHESGNFLVNGEYRLEFINTELLPASCVHVVDFVTASRMVVPEFHPLYLALTPDVYTGIIRRHPHLMLPSQTDHNKLLYSSASEDLSSGLLFLRVYYILSPVTQCASREATIRDASIEVMIEVHKMDKDGEFLFDAVTDNVKVEIRLYDADGIAVFFWELPRTFDSENLVPYLHCGDPDSTSKQNLEILDQTAESYQVW